MRKVVREESGGASMTLLERLVLLTEQLVAKDTTVKVAVDDRGDRTSCSRRQS